MSGETSQFGRDISCVVAAATGNGLEFKDFRVVFNVHRGDFQTPNTCDIRIYNLSDQTANLIAQKEYTNISLKAGYVGNTGLIFKGDIKQFRKGRENALDSYVDITAADGDEAYNFAPISVSLKAGTPASGIASALANAMAAKGVTQGYTPNFPAGNGAIRGRVLYGMTRDEIRDFAWANGCSWSIQDGQFVLIPLTSYIPGNVPLISAQSGLVGVPEQTQSGIHLKVLLNPNIRVGQTIKLDGTVNLLRYGLDTDAVTGNLRLQNAIKTNAQGLYYVMVANHSGDTRGTPWYTDLTCLAVDATVPMGDSLNALSVLGASSIPRYTN